MTRLLVVLSLSAVLAAPVALPASGAAPALDLARLLDDYSAGRFDQALRTVASAGDREANLLRTQWRTAGRLWIDAEPAAKLQRLLAAASFALETEHLRVERGAWLLMMAGVCPPVPKKPDAEGPAGPCVLEWAWSLLLERNVPDAAERAWVLGASALLGGVRGFTLIYRPTPGLTPEARGLVAEALTRHPDDARLRLEQAVAMSSRYNVTIDGGSVSPVQPAVVTVRGIRIEPGNRPDSRDNVAALLKTLVDDVEVGAEARLRLGYLLWASGDVELGRAELATAAKAAKAAKDDDLKYLATFLRGWAALRADMPGEAIADFTAALAFRPHSQSAAVALAALELQRGEAGRARELMQASLVAKPNDADPWKVFLYGHYTHLPGLIGDLRKQVRQ